MKKAAPKSAIRPPRAKGPKATGPTAVARPKSKDLLLEICDLRLLLGEAEETLRAIRSGEVDALMVSGPEGEQVYTLKGAEKPYRILVESMNEGALSLTESGAIIYCNRAFSKIAGTNCGMLVGTPFSDLVDEEDRDRLGRLWKQTLEGGAAGELRLRVKGTRLPVWVSMAAHVYGEERAISAVVTDISESKAKEEELRSARNNLERRVQERTEELQAANMELRKHSQELEALTKELEAFAYSVSHDLRAPLRSMSGFAKILLADHSAGLEVQGKDYLGRIYAAAEKMNGLIEDLLQLSRISHQNLDRMSVNISEAAESVIYNLKAASPSRDVAVVIAGGLRASADPDLIRVVLANLLDNAWKFTAGTQGARIEVGNCGSPEADCRIGSEILNPKSEIFYVRDNGAGFDQKYADKIFMPFQRLHPEKQFEGTGVGLSIVQRIIHRHGGEIWAEGEVGKGATVYFTLG